MPTVLLHPTGNTAAWLKHFHDVDPEFEVQVWPEIESGMQFEMAVSWYHPPGVLSQIKGLRCVASLGAGVEHILTDPDFPSTVQVTRVVDEGLAQEMTEYVVMMTLIHKRRYLQQLSYQRNRQWIKDADQKRDNSMRVGILGLGVLGRQSARALIELGMPVSGWSRTPKSLAGCRCYYGDNQLPDFLAEADVLVCLLPLTPRTEDILNATLFEKLPKGAFLINVGRGRHLVEQDLLDALANDVLSGACLDVFRTEPLPQDHPFWVHPKIQMTCHVSSITNPKNVARQIVENYRRLRQGLPLLHTVQIEQGY